MEKKKMKINMLIEKIRKEWKRMFDHFGKDDLEYLRRGNSSLQLGDYRSALAEYSKAISENPGVPEAFMGRGKANFELKNYKGAIIDCQYAIKLLAELEIKNTYTEDYTRYFAELYSIIGTSKLLLGKNEEAFVDLNSARLLGYEEAGYIIQYYSKNGVM
jgi:tetratricopeptide (TPR) repeat protein